MAAGRRSTRPSSRGHGIRAAGVDIALFGGLTLLRGSTTWFSRQVARATACLSGCSSQACRSQRSFSVSCLDASVAEVYVLLIAALLIAFRHNVHALGLVRCDTADAGLALGTCAAAYLVTTALQSVTGPCGCDDFSHYHRASVSARRARRRDGISLGSVRVAKRTLSPRAAIPLSAAAFAAIHGFPAVLPLAFALGLGFGWVRERSGSVLPAIIVHALHNGALIAWAYGAAGWTTRLPVWGAP
jgi:hypothetical protein